MDFYQKVRWYIQSERALYQLKINWNFLVETGRYYRLQIFHQLGTNHHYKTGS